MNLYEKAVAQRNKTVPFYRYQIDYEILNTDRVKVERKQERVSILKRIGTAVGRGDVTHTNEYEIPIKGKYIDYIFYYDDPDETEAERKAIVERDKGLYRLVGGKVQEVLSSLEYGKDYVLTVNDGERVYQPVFHFSA